MEATREKRGAIKNRAFLYATEFFAGMSVMAVELGASRLLAPYFSSSQIVWTIIIGTIMIAMALGNIFGGRSADKKPNPDILYGRIIIAAVWIALIPVGGKYIIIGISGLLIVSINNNFLVWAAFVSCMLIFVFPLFLLGTVTPSLAKFSVENLDDSGKIVGALGASNTIGSIIGTFVPTFVTIPSVGTSVTFLIFAAILLFLSAVYFISSRVTSKRLIAGFLIFVFCIFTGHSTSFAFWERDLTYEGESIYNYLQVSETDRAVYLSTNVFFGVQSMYTKDKGLTGMYYDYALAAAYMAGVNEKDELDVLILGMGSGTYATELDTYFDNVSVEGVEIDAEITKLARKYFSMPEDIRVTTYDGRAYLQAIDDEFDIIMVDAYQDITIPFQMSSVEFFTLVKEHLKDDGVMVVNMNMRGEDDDKACITDYLSDTIGSVFPNVYTVDVKGSTNKELFASKNQSVLEVFSDNISQEKNIELNRLMTDISMNVKEYEAGDLIMTDDKAPVELLGMKVIDSMINDEIDYYREIYKNEGISGLIDALN